MTLAPSIWEQSLATARRQEKQAVIAAQRLVDRPFGQLDIREFYALREALMVLGLFPARLDQESGR